MSARVSSPSRVTKLLIEAMAKHLPPSAAGLRLVDVEGRSGEILLAQRPDVEVTSSPLENLSELETGDYDAVVSFDVALADPFLSDALRLLRPGGRLITIDSERDPDEQPVKTLEAAGFTRILVDIGAECPLPVGTLARGERPHTTDDTLERVRVATGRDSAEAFRDYRGRYVHLLVQQTPNLPVWKLPEGTEIAWRAVVVNEESGDRTLLVFSSLPSAVAFMQEAVLKGTVSDINKVAKFKRETVEAWSGYLVWLNPTYEAFDGRPIDYVTLDPKSAEQPDE